MVSKLPNHSLVIKHTQGRNVGFYADSQHRLHAVYQQDGKTSWEPLIIRGIPTRLEQSELSTWKRHVKASTINIQGGFINIAPRGEGGMHNGEPPEAPQWDNLTFLSHENYEALQRGNPEGTNQTPSIVLNGRSVNGSITHAREEIVRVFGAATDNIREAIAATRQQVQQGAQDINQQVQSSIDLAQRRAQDVITQGGSEVRRTAADARGQFEGAVDHVQRSGQDFVTQTGTEIRRTAADVRGQVQDAVDHVQRSGQDFVAQTGTEIRRTAADVRGQVQGAVDHTAGAVRSTVNQIVSDTGAQGRMFLQDVNFSVNNMGDQARGCITQACDSANSIITNTGEQLNTLISTAATGGWAPAIAAGCTAVSEVSKFATSISYNFLAGKAGRELRETIETASREATQLLKESDDILSHLEDATAKSIRLAGAESKATAQIVSNALDQAGRDACLILEMADKKTMQLVRAASQESQQLCLLAGGTANNTILTAAGQTQLVISNAQASIRAEIDRAHDQIIRAGADELRSIVETTTRNIQTIIQDVHERSYSSLNELIRTASVEARGVILSFGQEGRLLIQEAGNEMRVVANEILANAVYGQQVVIRALGQEMRLTFREGERVIRDTLHSIPVIARQAGYASADGLISAALDKIRGVSFVDEILAKMRALNPLPEVTSLIDFVTTQSQLNPEDKLRLYYQMITMYNDPKLFEHGKKDWGRALFFIGFAAIHDRGLIKPGRVYGQSDWSSKVVEQIALASVRALLAKIQVDPTTLSSLVFHAILRGESAKAVLSLIEDNQLEKLNPPPTLSPSPTQLAIEASRAQYRELEESRALVVAEQQTMMGELQRTMLTLTQVTRMNAAGMRALQIASKEAKEAREEAEKARKEAERAERALEDNLKHSGLFGSK